MIQFALSSWSVHGLLGKARFAQNNDKTILESGQAQGELALLDLPAWAAQHGIPVLEICHFHFPSIDEAYLQQLKQNAEDHHIILENILIDRGNLAAPDDETQQASISMGKQWQQIAAQIGAKGCRFYAGLEPSTVASRQRAAEAFKTLVAHGNRLGLTFVTENFHATGNEAADLLAIMKQVGEPINVCVDFGNAEQTAVKMETLNALMPFATSIHCKANYHGEAIDSEDLHACLALLKTHQFSGPLTLIFNETEHEEANILALKGAVEKYGLS